MGIMHLVEQIEDDSTGGYTKRYDICQRIQLLTNGRRNTKCPGRHTIEKIKNGTHHNHQHSIVVLAVEGTARSYTATYQVTAGYSIGKVLRYH